MGPIAFRRVIECSSQDPAFPATNLLRSSLPAASPSSTRWQCTAAAAAREGRADVTLQLSCPARISHLDIGTFGCCMIEAQVSRSAGDGKFEVLLSSRTVRPPNQTAAAATAAAPRITMFNEGEFCRPVALREWDIIKIVCSIPVDRSSPFGIALLKLLSPDDPQTTAAGPVNVALRRRVCSTASPDASDAVAETTNTLPTVTIPSASDSKLALTPKRLPAKSHDEIDGSSPLHKLLFPTVAPSEARRDKRISDVKSVLTRISATSVGGSSSLPPSTSRSIDMVLKAVAKSDDRALSADAPQRTSFGGSRRQSGKKSTTFMSDLRETVAAVMESSRSAEDVATDCQVLLELRRTRQLNSDELLLLRTYVAEHLEASARESLVEPVASDDQRRRGCPSSDSPERPCHPRQSTLSSRAAGAAAGAGTLRDGTSSVLRSRVRKRSSGAAELSLPSDSSSDEDGGGRWGSAGSRRDRLVTSPAARTSATIGCSGGLGRNDTIGIAAGRPDELVCCPLCQGYYPADEIERHASSCQSDDQAGERTQPLNSFGHRRVPYRDGASATAASTFASTSFGASQSGAIVECPLCFDTFPADVVERHAGRCLGVVVLPTDDDDCSSARAGASVTRGWGEW